MIKHHGQYRNWLLSCTILPESNTNIATYGPKMHYLFLSRPSWIRTQKHRWKFGHLQKLCANIYFWSFFPAHPCILSTGRWLRTHVHWTVWPFVSCISLKLCWLIDIWLLLVLEFIVPWLWMFQTFWVITWYKLCPSFMPLHELLTLPGPRPPVYFLSSPNTPTHNTHTYFLADPYLG